MACHRTKLIDMRPISRMRCCKLEKIQICGTEISYQDPDTKFWVAENRHLPVSLGTKTWYRNILVLPVWYQDVGAKTFGIQI